MSDGYQPIVMSEDQEKHLRDIMREEIRAFSEDLELRDQRAIAARRWLIGSFGLALVYGGVQIVSDHTTLASHTSDGHPQAVINMVQEIKPVLREIQVQQAHIREDLAEVKKGIIKPR